MKRILIVISIICSHSVFFQSFAKSPSSLRLENTSIGINFLAGTLFGKNYFSDHDFKLSYSTGFVFQFKTNKRFALLTGIQFSSMSSQEKLSDYTRWDSIELPNGPNPYPDDSLISRYQNCSTVRFIDLPITATYFWGKGKTKFTVNTGIILNYFINQKLTVTHIYQDDGVVKIDYSSSPFDSKSKIQMALLFSPGIDKELNDYYHFKVEPTVRYQPSGLSNDIVGKQLFELGINFTILRLLD